MTEGPPSRTDRLLRRAAERAAADPFYLAHALHAFQQSESLDDVALASWLGCAPDDLSRLALCRRPGALFRLGSPDHEQAFLEEVTAMSERFGLRRGRLAGLLRSMAFVEEAARPAAADPADGYMMAARDREDGTEEPTAEKATDPAPDTTGEMEP